MRIYEVADSCMSIVVPALVLVVLALALLRIVAPEVNYFMLISSDGQGVPVSAGHYHSRESCLDAARQVSGVVRCIASD